MFTFSQGSSSSRSTALSSKDPCEALHERRSGVLRKPSSLCSLPTKFCHWEKKGTAQSSPQICEVTKGEAFTAECVEGTVCPQRVTGHWEKDGDPGDSPVSAACSPRSELVTWHVTCRRLEPGSMWAPGEDRLFTHHCLLCSGSSCPSSPGPSLQRDEAGTGRWPRVSKTLPARLPCPSQAITAPHTWTS